jgi:hypothetical protein
MKREADNPAISDYMLRCRKKGWEKELTGE